MRVGFVMLIVGVMLPAVGACTSKQPSEPALAEVHSARLRTHMGHLGEAVLADLEIAVKGPQVRQDLARIAEDLQAIATRLPDVVYSLDLNEDERSHFVAFADSLGASAARLEEAAPVATGSVIQARIDEVTNACAGCHWAFRVGPGT
ncbi:MAG: cytochrome c [Deltaproteobacteria bacterium]|nr:cytochrome c [Deltaproteobacteria bacterium]MBW2446716.1 cytochrome c [Deltaproteobacteria bacterium]